MGGGKMYKTFTQMNELLRTAAQISPKNCGGKKIEDIATETNISTAMLYKWRSGSNMSLDKLDALLNYFQINEPNRLEMAERILGW